MQDDQFLEMLKAERDDKQKDIVLKLLALATMMAVAALMLAILAKPKGIAAFVPR